jgi:hypothetical protein
MKGTVYILIVGFVAKNTPRKGLARILDNRRRRGLMITKHYQVNTITILANNIANSQYSICCTLLYNAACYIFTCKARQSE